MKASLWKIIGLASIIILALQARMMSQSTETNSQISTALSAAPPSVADGAAAVSMDDQGNMKELRPATNGWTCVTHNATTLKHDAIEHHPACFDKYGLEWIEAYIAGRAPDLDHVGYSYMLKGGSSWSNTDPSAAKLSPGQKDFIRLPPHIMILNAKIANSSGFPSGQVSPDTHAPFVMFGGTPYAILIIPVS